jgi:hypothetical protein
MRNIFLSLSQGVFCSLNGDLNHKDPNLPISTTLLGNMAGNIIISFPGNWKRCAEYQVTLHSADNAVGNKKKVTEMQMLLFS